MSEFHESPNKATLRRLLEVTNSHDEELISKTFDELFDPDAAMAAPLPLEVSGAEAIKEVFKTLHRAYPDLRVTIEDLIEEGDKVVARNTVTGTHQGEYMGVAPTGKSVTYDEIFVIRFADGRIAQTWGVVDVVSQMRQLGLLQL